MTTGSSPNEASSSDARSSLWRNRDFNLLWTGQTLSDLGSWTSMLAIPLLVLSLTASATQAGTVGTVAAVVRSVVRLPGGALADRWNRRAVMLAADAARMCLYAALAAAVGLGHAPVALIVVVVVISVLFDVVYSPAETASVSNLVDAPQLPDAFARNEARSYGTSLVGPPLGGVLYAVSRTAPFLFDAASYLASFITVLRSGLLCKATEWNAPPILC